MRDCRCSRVPESALLKFKAQTSSWQADDFSIEVSGLEWSFADAGEDSTTLGVGCVEPDCHPLHRYRQTVRLGFTQHSAEDMQRSSEILVEEYDEHDMLTCNCCHFADEFF